MSHTDIHRDDIEEVRLHPADVLFALGCFGTVVVLWVFAAIGVIVTIGRLLP